jgi:hypothetical protein
MRVPGGKPPPICQEPHRPGRRKVKQRTFSEAVSSLAIRGRNRYPPLGAPMQVRTRNFGREGQLLPATDEPYAHFRKSELLWLRAFSQNLSRQRAF